MAAIAYLTALLAYVGLALALLFVALPLALIPRFRPRAKWLALGVPGSFIGVFGSQLAAAPIVLALVWTVLLPVGSFDGGGVTTNPFIILLAIASILVAAAFFGSVSLAGFVVGWRAANALGEGTPLRAFFASDKI